MDFSWLDFPKECKQPFLLPTPEAKFNLLNDPHNLHTYIVLSVPIK